MKELILCDLVTLQISSLEFLLKFRFNLILKNKFNGKGNIEEILYVQPKKTMRLTLYTLEFETF